MHDDDGTRPLKIIAIGAVVVGIALSTVVAHLLVGNPQPPTATTIAAARTEVAPTAKRVRPTAKWIWGRANDMACVLRRAFEAPHGVRAEVRIACDNHGVVFVNDQRVAANDNWRGATTIDITSALKEGANDIRIEARNDDGPAAVVAELRLRMPDGSDHLEVTNEDWKLADDAPARVVATLGDSPWGQIPGIGPSDIDRGIRVPEGFVCELVCAIPLERGSIVALAAAKDGTIVASGENSAFIRIDPCAIGADPETTKITPIDLPIGGAQGLVFRGDDLYAVVNSTFAKGPGLYRLPDANHDGTFDKVELLRAIPGSPSEHGAHGVVNGPDGDLYVVCGNHVKMPAPERSRLRRDSGEDQLLPRMWDPNGHAVGILAPCGWVCRTDPDGKEWEVISAGFRNSYDIAFSAEGELFTFDSDMEWDMGAPWYRPTRVLHCVSGGEFGSRSGSYVWPSYYADSLPATIDIGPSSPTGMMFGTELAFPDPWRSALFLCDWTFGTMHAVTLHAEGASFTGTREVFLTGKPLPIADVVASPRDGAMYFAIGGRGAASAIYRVRWTGEPAPKPSAIFAGSQARNDRHSLELSHRDDADAGALYPAWVALDSDDRFIRWAARTVLEHQPVDRWQSRALEEKRPYAALECAIALARCDESSQQPKLLERLLSMSWDALNVEQRRMWLRGLELSIIRQGKPDDDTRRALLKQLEKVYPCDDFAANRELCALLVALDSRVVVARAIPLLEKADVESERFDESLLRRSDSYGSVILRMAAQSPQREQMHVAMCLRLAKDGWTDDLRRRYFNWFRGMQRTSGGLSFAGFLEHARRDALALVPEKDRDRYEKLSKQDDVDPDLPRAQGPGRHWTIDEVVALANDSAPRDFKRGETMFRAASCATCHRFVASAPTGGGPDLTGVGNRFGPREIAEAIVEPSRVISDQYQMTEFELRDGTLVVGRLVDEEGKRVRIIENFLTPTITRDIDTAIIAQRRPSAVSPMMPGMVDGLNRDELADLLAYLLSGGDERAAVFRIRAP